MEKLRNTLVARQARIGWRNILGCTCNWLHTHRTEEDVRRHVIWRPRGLPWLNQPGWPPDLVFTIAKCIAVVPWLVMGLVFAIVKARCWRVNSANRRCRATRSQAYQPRPPDSVHEKEVGSDHHICDVGPHPLLDAWCPSRRVWCPVPFL